ncbi:hypothetical protein EXIGLDRAFT_636720, partial [Exidia glandulosa HHB12029]
MGQPPLRGQFAHLRGQNNKYAPFASQAEWELAQWVKNEGLSDAAFDRFCKLSSMQGDSLLGVKNSGQLNSKIDELPGYGTWSYTVVTVDGSETKHELFYRDPTDCLRALWADPAFKDHLSFAPEKHFADAAHTNRLYTDMKTGDWWWQMQGKIPIGSTVVPIIISSDKTELTLFTGGATAYPIYMTIGNIADHIRRQPSRHAQVLIGYLPTSAIDTSGLTELAARNARAQLFHTAVRTILEPLRSAAKIGIELQSSDGAVRSCYPLLAVYAGDYPEQCLAACTRYGTRCPKCDIDKAGFSSGLEAGISACEGSLSSIDDALRAFGLNFVPHPFWEDWEHADIHQAITPDILHQLYQGLIKHLTAWATHIVGEDELDARFRRVPLAQGLRHFKDGISCLSRVSGVEHKAIAKQLLACLAGIPEKDAVRAARALLDFTYLAQYGCHSNDTLELLDESLREFHKYKDVFLNTGATESLDLPKLHGLLHYTSSIRLFGTTGGYNTEQTERLHIDYAKEAYDASNHREDDIFPFMCTWLERREKIFRFATYLAYLDNKVHVALKRPPSKRENPPVAFAKHPNARARNITYIKKEHGAQLFAEEVVKFVQTYVKAEWTKKHPGIPVPRYEIPSPDCLGFDIWHQVKFHTPDIQTLHAPATLDTARATPIHKTRTKTVPARFDPVMVELDGDGVAGEGGMDGIRIAQVRVLFRLPTLVTDIFARLRIPAPGTLAYIEWFSKLGRPDEATGMYHVQRSFKSGAQDGVRQATVIEAIDIRRICHLVARLKGHKPSIPLYLNVHNIYERWSEFWVNNFVD